MQYFMVFSSEAENEILSIEWVLEAISPRAKWPRHEAGYSLPFNTEVKNVRSFTSISLYCHGASA